MHNIALWVRRPWRRFNALLSTSRLMPNAYWGSLLFVLLFASLFQRPFEHFSPRHSLVAPKSIRMSNPYSLDSKVTGDALAWDTLSQPERGSALQPWREFWPPRKVDRLTPDQVDAKPWLTWKRDKSLPNDKPWYHWCNVFTGEVDLPCQRRDGEGDCQYCDGKGCVRPCPSLFCI